MNDTAQYVVFCLIHLPFRPIIFILVPIATIAIFNSSSFLKQNPSLIPDKLKSRLMEAVDKVTEPNAIQALLINNATIEAMLVLLLLLTVFVGGSILHLFLHLQFLRFKFMTSRHSQFAWAQIAQTLDKGFHHRFCPRPVGAIFDKIKGFIRRYATNGAVLNQ